MTEAHTSATFGAEELMSCLLDSSSDLHSFLPGSTVCFCCLDSFVLCTRV